MSVLPAEIIRQLQEILGAEQVSQSEHDCILYAQDVFTKADPAALVIKPLTAESLAKAVKLASDNNIAVVARGGGMSYTKGYVPINDSAIIVDMTAMDNVIEVNNEDMYVTVEAGCTWKKLHETLKETGLRTPFWGTLSGINATVGGGLSQNAIFWGSGQHGFAIDSVTGIEVVLSNGELLQTGAGAQVNGSPFARHYGPDLTGLFCGDNAAFGIKTQVSLRLIKALPFKGALSFCFDSFEQQSAVMTKVAQCSLASECFGFDPFLQAQRLKRESLASDVKSLVGVMKSAGGITKGIKEGMKVALAGRNFVEAESWSVHFMVEDLIQAGVDERIKQIREIATNFQANEIENTIPKVLSAHPFGPVNNMIGPNGERWAPVHTLVPHSKATLAYQTTEAVFDEHRSAIEKYNIGVGYLVATVSSNVFVLEPVFFWPDELNELHKAAVENAHLKRIKGFEPSLEARAAVTEIRQALIHAYKEIGGIHMQIGKTYLFQEGIQDANRQLLTQIKDLLDGNNTMNPASLGFKVE